MVVPAGHLYRIVAIGATLVTSAVAATRVARMAYGDGVRSYITTPPQSSQVASLTRLYSWFLGGSGNSAGSAILSRLLDFTLEPGWTIGPSTELIDVGDQWSNVFLLLEDTTVRDGALDLADLAIDQAVH